MKALSDRPYWGKPAVRLIGEVVETAASYEARYAPPPPYPTIIQSPLRATVLPDCGGRQVTCNPSVNTVIREAERFVRLFA